MFRQSFAVPPANAGPYDPSDIYCYECNDSRLDLDLARHLANFGINVAQQTKTEKTMTELVRSIASEQQQKLTPGKANRTKPEV